MGADLAVVITQCDREELNENNQGVTSLTYKTALKNAGINNDVFETMTTVKDDSLELDKLIEWSSECLPVESLKASFIGAQKSNLGLKHSQADKTIAIAAISASGAAGLNPVPASDSVLIMPIQIGLSVTLARIYGFDALGSSVMSLLKNQIVSLVGRQLATSLTKLIPFIGQIINAAVAGAITYGVGRALKELYSKAYLDYLETGNEPNWVVLFSGLDIDSFLKNNILKTKK